MQWVIPAGGHLLVPSSQLVLELMLFNILINDLSNEVEVIPWNVAGEVMGCSSERPCQAGEVVWHEMQIPKFETEAHHAEV